MAARAGITFHAVTPSRWDDFARLFEGRGGPKYCWCMVYRADRDEVKPPRPCVSVRVDVHVDARR